MSDSIEEFDFAFQNQLSINGDQHRFRSSFGGGMHQDVDDNVARIITSSNQGNLSSSLPLSPSHRTIPAARMGFRAYQAAVRENRENRDYSYSSDNHSDDAEGPINRSLVAAMNDNEEESFHLINISIYDSTNFASTILRINRRLTSKEVCRALSHKMDLSKDEAMYHTLVVVITVFDSEKRINMHCVRTFQNDEIVLNVLDGLVAKLTDRYKVLDVTRMKNTIRWYFKDVRTPPIEFPDGEEATGEDSSDDEEEVSHSDLAYLAKAERKGYLLKRSSRDQNLWRKWYCVLTDHLWCIDIQKKVPTAICIRLSGMIRSSHHHNKHNSSYNNRVSRDRSTTGNGFGFPFSNSTSSSFLPSSFSSGSAPPPASSSGNLPFSSEEQQLHSIVINSTRGTHLLRAFSLSDQKKWIEDLHAKTKFALENDYFNMAEVIICDEENTKSKRFHKSVNELLEIPMFYESLSLDHRSLQYTTVTVDLTDDFHTGNTEVNQTQRSNISRNTSGKLTPMSVGSSVNNQIDPSFGTDMEFLDLPIPAAPSTTATLKVNDDESVVVEALRNRLPSSATINTSHTMHPMVSTRVQFSTVNPMDRTLHTSSLHQLFRHDLFITQSYQRQIAVYIFVKYLLPILQIQASSSYQKQQGLSSRSGVDLSLDEVDMNQVAKAVQQFSGKAMKNNGFIQDEKELVRYGIQIQSMVERSFFRKTESLGNVSSPQIHQNLREDPPSDGTFMEDAHEQVNRLDLLWDLSHNELIRVYQALFVCKATTLGSSPLSLTGTTNSDRYKASGAAERSLHQEDTKATQNTSFWSWFATSSSTNSGESGGLRSNKSRFVEDELNVNESAVNFPSQDIFDPIVEALIKMLLAR